MELNIHELIKQVKFFGVCLNNYDNYNPIIVSINENGRTEVEYFEELARRVE